MESSACIVKLSGPPPTFLPVHGSDKWAGLEPGDPQTHWMVLQKSVRPSPRRAPRSSRCAADMANQTNTSAPFYSYEYYLDYLDLIPVDERKLKANKHSIVIVFWVSLAAFVVLLFLILLYMSWSGSPQMRDNTQHHPTCPWSHSLNLPFCVRRHSPHHRDPRGTRQAPPSSAEEPGSRASGRDQQPQGESPSALSPTAPQAHCALLWELTPDGDPHRVS
ncbi:melanocortin-2 receptor accessory protein isoform X1 [Equus przewalskii]|uniref:Melanocortin-2 receptor accessory protein isoform X1 n=2 Tax=Equus przewalskii TaxID=9798 RepID=A0ABM2EHR8_EQUPR